MADKKSVVPLYIYNGAQEWWIPAARARNLFAEQCRLGATAVYREYFGEHITTMFTGFPGAMTWLDARLRGVPLPMVLPGRVTIADLAVTVVGPGGHSTGQGVGDAEPEHVAQPGAGPRRR